LVKLASVRVGKFTAENVECVVLGEQAINAPPLLGMSFLGQFKFELDAAQSLLKLVKVDSGETAPSSSKSKRKPK
jgi:aspartyl protease family protein